MMSIRCLILLLTWVWTGAAPAHALRVPTQDWIVALHDQQDPAVFFAGAVTYRPIVPALRTYLVVAFPPWQPDPAVRYARPDENLASRRAPNDPFYADQYFHPEIGLEDAWEYGTGGTTADGRRIVVAVIDSGFDIGHADLDDNLWTNPGEVPGNELDDDGNGLPDDMHGWNYIDNTVDFNLNKDHGTGVAGIVGAEGDNQTNGSGVNWDIELMLLGAESLGSILAASNYVYEQRLLYNATGGAEGAFVVAANYSLGLNNRPCKDEPLWNDLMQLMGEAGILPVGATSNERDDIDEVGDLPTSCDNPYLISVAASNRQGGIASAYGGTHVDLTAPGVDVYTIRNFNRSEPDASGTSYAAPLVSGTVALLYAMPCTALLALADADPGAAALAVRRAVLEGVTPRTVPGSQTVTGGGLHAFGALERLHDFCISPAPLRTRPLDYLRGRAPLLAYPNPVSATLTVEFATSGFGASTWVRVFDAVGRPVAEQRGSSTLFEPQRLQFDTRAWVAGTYFLTVWNGRSTQGLGVIKIE